MNGGRPSAAPWTPSPTLPYPPTDDPSAPLHPNPHTNDKTQTATGSSTSRPPGELFPPRGTHETPDTSTFHLGSVLLFLCPTNSSQVSGGQRKHLGEVGKGAGLLGAPQSWVEENSAGY